MFPYGAYFFFGLFKFECEDFFKVPENLKAYFTKILQIEVNK